LGDSELLLSSAKIKIKEMFLTVKFYLKCIQGSGISAKIIILRYIYMEYGTFSKICNDIYEIE